MEGDEFAAVEIHDFQGLVEILHLHGIYAEFAHLEELLIVTGNRSKREILGQFLVEFPTLLRIVAVDFAEAEEHGGEGVAA